MKNFTFYLRFLEKFSVRVISVQLFDQVTFERIDSYPLKINDITLKFVVFVTIRRYSCPILSTHSIFPYKMSDILTRWRWDGDLAFWSLILTESRLPVVWRANHSRQILMIQRTSVSRFLTDPVRESYESDKLGRMLLSKRNGPCRYRKTVTSDRRSRSIIRIFQTWRIRIQ